MSVTGDVAGRRPGPRHARRPFARIHTALVALASVAVLAGAMTPVVTSAAPAQASEASIMGAAITTNESARAPSAVVDQFGNQYVFWRGSDSRLWEGWYDIYTRKWHGPVKLGMGPLVSEPSAAASPTQVFAGPGGKPFSALFLYWEGTKGSLWMAYWEHGWKGPVRLAPSTGGIQATICSQPSAAFVNPPSGQYIQLYWEGVRGGTKCTGSLSRELFGAVSKPNVVNPTKPSDYFGPQFASEAGQIYSAPSVAATFSPMSEGACLCEVMVVWRDNHLHLRADTYNVSVSHPAFHTQEDTSAKTLGSLPSVGGNGDGIFDIAWRGSGGSHTLWLSHFDSGTLHFGTPTSLPKAGTLGSAPSVGESAVLPDFYVFWTGASAKRPLWEAFWNASTSAWRFYNRGMGPL
jgi:hypothetical protein